MANLWRKHDIRLVFMQGFTTGAGNEDSPRDGGCDHVARGVLWSGGLAAAPCGEAQPAKRGDQQKATCRKGDNCRLTPGEELNVT